MYAATLTFIVRDCSCCGCYKLWIGLLSRNMGMAAQQPAACSVRQAAVSTPDVPGVGGGVDCQHASHKGAGSDAMHSVQAEAVRTCSGGRGCRAACPVCVTGVVLRHAPPGQAAWQISRCMLRAAHKKRGRCCRHAGTHCAVGLMVCRLFALRSCPRHTGAV